MHSLTFAKDGGEWSASHPSHFTSRERAHWIGGWVGPRAILDAVVKRKIYSPCQESNPRTPIIQPIAQHYTGFIYWYDHKFIIPNKRVSVPDFH
jgi:hypothetical protein